jgi:hypothetical protein
MVTTERKTIRRDVLKRLAKKGNLVYVGGYNFDDMLGASRSDDMEKPLPVKYRESGEPRSPSGTVDVDASDFDTSSGGAWESVLLSGMRLIHLRIHSNSSMDFVRADEWKRVTEAKAAVEKAERDAEDDCRDANMD